MMEQIRDKRESKHPPSMKSLRDLTWESVQKGQPQGWKFGAKNQYRRLTQDRVYPEGKARPTWPSKRQTESPRVFPSMKGIQEFQEGENRWSMCRHTPLVGCGKVVRQPEPQSTLPRVYLTFSGLSSSKRLPAFSEEFPSEWEDRPTAGEWGRKFHLEKTNRTKNKGWSSRKR